MLPVACFRCTLPGHGWAECQRPGAVTRQELGQRIEDIKIRWDGGRGFATGIKTQIIEAEIRAYEKARKAA